MFLRLCRFSKMTSGGGGVAFINSGRNGMLAIAYGRRLRNWDGMTVALWLMWMIYSCFLGLGITRGRQPRRNFCRSNKCPSVITAEKKALFICIVGVRISRFRADFTLHSGLI